MSKTNIPSANIEWTKIPKGALVTLVKVGDNSMFVVKVKGQPDAVPFWGSHDALNADKWLTKQVQRAKPVTGQQLFMRNHLT